MRRRTANVAGQNRAKHHALKLHSEHELLLAVELSAFTNLTTVIAHCLSDLKDCSSELIELSVNLRDLIPEIKLVVRHNPFPKLY